jgi:di/tricarboxylate transporter
MLFSISTADIVFSGFQSTAVWLIFGGLILGIAINSTGLGKRIGARATLYLHGSYLKIISGLVVAGILFSFLMPSAMGRVVLLTPIGIAIANHFGFSEGTNGRTGILLAIIFGTYFPAFAILPANVPNMVMVGMAETQYRISPLYGSYLLLHFPVLGLLKAALIIGIIVYCYPDQPMENGFKESQQYGKLSREEKKLSITILLLLALWMTDFIHHISPAWVTLAGALFLLLPKFGIISSQQFNQKINWGSLIFVAGILGLGGVINHSGLGKALAGELLSLLPLGQQNEFVNYLSISLASTLTGVATTLPGVPAVFTPLSDSISQATALPIKTVLMMQVVGFSTTIFPYQAPPIIIGMQLSGEKFSSAIKLCLILATLTLIFLLPVNYIWWRLLGWI